RYTLYVPENYDPSRAWPVVVALHGGGGNDHDFVWLYLKHAKSRGYLVVVPKSIDVTWTFSDSQVVLAALQEVASMYSVDRSAVFLTGVSDGGTFTYEFGLSNPEVFAALAPVAGGFIPWPWHDFAHARKMPVYILHGAQDKIIPVEFARSAREVLGKYGYPLVYRELADWGHAWPLSKMGEVFGFFEDVRQGRIKVPAA
ncbi:MAG: dienelactone hydrolase family protein, partial [Chloroflexota bacterium]